MEFKTFDICGPLLIVPKRIGDTRGWFAETFRADLFLENAGPVEFVQHNQSMSAAKGTVRGMHFQLEPMAQGKLVRCLKGAILDVVVDIRRSSLTFGQHVSAELTAENGHQLWVPPGFAHGFVTLVENTEVFYLVTSRYSPAHDRGLLWSDPALGIDWRIREGEAQLSDKDRKLPVLNDLQDLFD
ncbi:dTDP-4-dehydrorhamnose 3,5-epimerase [Rhizobium sp. TH2]|uniref:dTDP-4-dehydrorhamnose 3,5-epimerase n=1 Tax=Rhizobium sp. TH2 TaxID=2775403 RepID=UPI002157EFD0|nr:dTDP-4-dehydrorhamnose 3,5-epimerase [Rhizobium sp. TH2]UVC11682.1 dTDP-4-dehydrorhamnose 3,5-epimerase [Rhizobium sp. TH2]